MKFISVKKENQILTIELNRPDVRNAFHPQLISQLTDEFTNIDADVRLVYLKGAGQSFCAGADLEWMKSMVGFSLEENKSDSAKLYEMFEAMWNCPVPLITKVHGHVFGGALGMLAVSDVCCAETSTLFCFSEVRIGLIPAVISDFVIRKARAADCYRYMLSGRRFSAEVAQQMGLCHFSGSDDDCNEFVSEFKQDILKSGPAAVRKTKELIRKVSNITDNKELTAKLIAEARISKEGQEGLGAFFEKRKANWCE